MPAFACSGDIATRSARGTYRARKSAEPLTVKQRRPQTSHVHFSADRRLCELPTSVRTQSQRLCTLSLRIRARPVGTTIRPAILQTSNSKVAENWNGHVKTLPQVGTSVAQPRGDHRRQLLALALRLSRQPARCNTYPASSVLQLQHRKQLHLRRPQYRSRSVSAVGETVAAGSLRRGKSNCIAAFPTASVGCYARIADCMYSTPSTVQCEVGCSASSRWRG